MRETWCSSGNERMSRVAEAESQFENGSTIWPVTTLALLRFNMYHTESMSVGLFDLSRVNKYDILEQREG